MEDLTEILEAKELLELRCMGHEWFESVSVDHDDAGSHLELRVTSSMEMRKDDAAPWKVVPNVRVLLLSVGKKAVA